MTCGKSSGAYLATTIASILFTTIFTTVGIWTVGVSRTGDVERETVPWVEQVNWDDISFWYSTKEIKGLFSEPK